MILYKCEICEKIFSTNGNLKKHKNKQKSCKNISEQQCQYCLKTFCRKNYVSVHINKSCKIKKQLDNDKETIYQNLIKEKQIMSENMNEINNKLSKLENKQTTNIINNNITNNTNNTIINNTINNNIKITAFGKEDLHKISDAVIAKIMNKGLQSVLQLIKYVHYNENKPENHNVYISNLRDSYAMFFNGDDWKLKQKEEIIDQLLDDKKCHLLEKFDDLINNLDEKRH
jgi:hypothetical protein